MGRRRALFASAIGLTLVLSAALPAWGLGPRAAIPDVTSDIADVEQQLTEVRATRLTAQTARDQARSAYDGALARLSDAQLAEEEAQATLAGAEGELAAAEADMAQVAQRHYLDASGSLAALEPLLSPASLEEALQRSEMLHRIGSAESRAIDRLAVARQSVANATARAQLTVEANREAAISYEQALSQAQDAVAQAEQTETAALAQRDALIGRLAALKRADEATERASQQAADRAAGLDDDPSGRAPASPDPGGTNPGTTPATAPTHAPITPPIAPTSAPTAQPTTPAPAPTAPTPAPPSDPIGPSIDGYRDANVPSAYRSWVVRAGSECAGVGPAIVAAQIQAESSWNPNAVSSVGAQGLAQFMPGTWAAWGRDDDGNGQVSPFDPGDAIMAQGRYMCALYAQMDRYLSQGRVGGDRLDLALASYNQGAGTILKAGGIPTGGGAARYVTKIRTLAQSTYS